MNDARKTKARLIEEIEELRRRLGEIEGERRANDAAHADRFRAILDHAPQIMLEIDAEGRVLYANRLLSGRPVSSALGREAAGFLPDEARDRFREAYAEALRERRAITFPVDDVLLQGHRYSIVVHVRPIVNDGGPPTASVIVDDVTERRTLTREIETHVELEGLLLRISGEFAAVLDPSGFDDLVPGVLRRVGEALGAGQASLFLFDDSKTRIRRAHEWRRCDRPPPPTAGDEVPVDALPWITGRLLAGETVLLRGLRDIPPEAEKERRWFAEYGIAHVLDVPLHVEGLVRGFLGFKWTEATDSLSPITRFALGALGQILGYTLTRVRDRESAERSRAGYRNLIEQSLVGIGVLQGTPPRFVFANRAAAGFVNCTVDELLRKTPEEVADLIDPAGRNEVFTRYADRLAGKDVPSRFEVVLAPVAGSPPRVLEMYARPIDYLDAPAVQLVAVDITPAREAEKARRSSEERFRLLTESAKELIFTIDRSMRMTYVNPAFSAYDGRPRWEIEGRALAELLPPEIARDREANVRHVLERGLPEELRISFPWRGRLNYLELSMVPLRAEGEEITEILCVARDVTEQHEADLALRRSEEMYRLLSEGADDMIFLVDRQMRVRYSNPAHLAFRERSKVELVGRRIDEIMPAEDAEGRIRNVETVFRTGERIVEERAVRVGDRETVLSTSLSPIKDRDGSVAFVLGISRDVLEDRRREERLRESEEKYRRLSESSSDFISVIDSERRIRYMNRALKRRLGGKTNELLGRDMADFVDAETAKDSWSKIRAAMTSGETVLTERRLGDPGSEIWTLSTIVPLLDRDGRYSSVMVVSRNISDLKRKEQALRRSEEKYRALAESARDFIFVVDRELSVTYVNEAGARAFGRTPEEMAGGFVGDLFSGETAKMFERNIRTVFETGESHRAERPVSFPGVRIWLDTTLVPLHGEDGVIFGVMGLSRDITALKEAEERYRTLAESSRDFIFVTRADGSVEYANTHAAALLGRSPSEVVGRRLTDIFPRSYAETFAHEIGEVFATGQPREIERLLELGERSIWALSTLTPIKNHDGSVTTVMCVSRDITKRRHTELEHRRSEERLRAIFEGASVGFVIAERESYGLVMTNPAAREMFGYGEDELAELTVPDLHPPGVFDKLLREDTIRTDEETRLYHEALMKRKDGSVFHADIGIVDIELTGRPHVLGIVQDVTDRLEAERALRESRSLLQKTFETLHDGAFIVENERETIIDCNPAAIEIFGYARNEFVGRHPKMILPDESGVGPFRALLFEKIEKEGMLKNHEMIMRRKDGSLFPVAHTVIPLHDDDGECFGWLAVTRDITERREAERRKKQYTEELEEGVRERTKQIEILEARRAQDQKLVAIAHMAARIAHEIKNPLAGMRNAFHLVKEGVSPDFEHYAYVGMIDREIKRISEIVNQMSRLYRPAGEASSPVDFGACLADVISILGLEAKERNVEITALPVAGRKTAPLPEGLLREILYNLVRNAVEASPPGAAVRVTAEVGPSAVDFRVTDRGKGIPEAIRARIFEAFFSTKSEVMTGGQGLGLAIVKSNVDVMGGTIDIETEEGKGTTFHVRLPVKE